MVNLGDWSWWLYFVQFVGCLVAGPERNRRDEATLFRPLAGQRPALQFIDGSLGTTSPTILQL